MERPTSFMGMEQKVDRTIRAKRFFTPGDRIVVAVSGGPDSVALFRCLVSLRERWNWDLCLGHVDHGFRGAESEEDASFVQDIGKKFGVPVLIRRLFLNKQEVRQGKLSLQEYARTLRYQALEEMVRDWDGTKLALGHNADDQAETVLMWMLRGSGTGGLGGIPPKRGAYVVRPLLDITRSEIVTYLQERQEEYRVDSTNFQPVYLRNRIRQDLMPQLKTYSTGIVNVLTRQAHILRDDHAYLEELAHEVFLRTCVSQSTHERQLDRLALLRVPFPIRRRVVRQSLQQIGGNTHSPRFDVVERILNRLEHGQSGWAVECKEVRVFQEYDRVVFCRRGERSLPAAESSFVGALLLPIPGEVVWFPTGQRITVSMKLSPIEGHVHSSEIHLDPTTFTPELSLRSWRPGDSFYPKGLQGRQKKLQDFFSDIKLPRSQRTRVPLLVAPEGILWVGGLRADERFQISPSTMSVIVAKMIV